MLKEKEIDYSKPVAYDSEGRPLYAHPPKASVTPQPAVRHIVHPSRAAEPAPMDISEAVKIKHADSVKKYPMLNLSESEYVISEVKRHPIGKLSIIGTVVVMSLLVLMGMIAYPSLVADSTYNMPPASAVIFPGTMLIILFALGGYVALWVYMSNTFYLTNESVIQEIQKGLFSRHEQTVSLGSIEDASFRKSGLLQSMFDYGSIRLSTEGEETTYRFEFVSNPKEQIAVLNNAVEAFKNGRPVED